MTHTLTPWVYRPNRFDDWGYIRGPAESGERFGDIAAIARGGDDKTHDEHRAAGTDPYAANAAFIVKAVNSHEALVKALQEISAQKLTKEMDLEPGDYPDYEYAYEAIIAIARDALHLSQEKQP